MVSTDIISKMVTRRPRKFIQYKTSSKKYLNKFKGLIPKNASSRQKLIINLTYFFSFVLFAVLAGIFIIVIALAIFSRDLPNPNALLERSEDLSTKLMDRNGESIYEVFGEKNRQLIQLEDVAKSLIEATMAVEDSNFYSHQGISIRGMIRAVKNIALGGSLQSGSTITQQVVKNALLTQDQTVSRKLKEIVLSLQLENRYEKDQILQMYLNETPYGGQSYGALTAAKAYFSKLPAELTIAESAFLAGLPQSPTRYSPYSSDPSAGLARKDYVLYLMNERGWLDANGERHYLNDEDYEIAKVEILKFEPASASFKAPHFVFYVKEVLADLYGEEFVEQAGLQVTTSLDLELQEAFQEIVREEVAAAGYANVNNGSLVAIDPQTGQILAMVGSKDYFAESEPEGCISGITGENSCVFEPNLNVTLAKRQPGSSIKPITYATMLSQGYTAAFPLLDVPTVFRGADAGKDYTPVNYDGEFRGSMSVRKSLANSINISAVKAVQLVGVSSMIDTAQRLGITTFDQPERYGPAITLGGGETKLLEMTTAFAAFGAGGVYREPTPILEVKDAMGNILYSYRDTGGEQAVDEEVAFLISDILSDDGARSEIFGFGSLLNISGQQVAVKTGTTDDKRDNYALGYTKEIAIGTWVGNNNNEKMGAVASGISGATPIWRRAMLEFIKDKEPNFFDPPDTVKKFEVDKLTGGLPYQDFDTRTEWLILGTEPTSVSNWYQRLKICKEDGKLVNDDCDDAGDTKTRTFIGILAAFSGWQMDVDAWISENFSDKSEYFPPLMKSRLEYDGDDVKKRDPEVEIVGMSNNQEVPKNFRLKVEVSSARDIDRVKIYLDGEKVSEDKSFPYGYNFEFNDGQLGSHEFKAVVKDEKGNEGEDRITLRVIGS